MSLAEPENASELSKLLDLMLAKAAGSMRIYGPEITRSSQLSTPNFPFAQTWIDFRIDYILTGIPNTSAFLRAAGTPNIPIPQQRQFMSANFLVRAISLFDSRLHEYQLRNGLAANRRDRFFDRIEAVCDHLNALNRIDLHDVRQKRNDLAHDFPGPDVTDEVDQWIGVVESALVDMGDLPRTFEIKQGSSSRHSTNLVKAEEALPEHQEFVNKTDHYAEKFLFNIDDGNHTVSTYEWTYVYCRWVQPSAKQS